MNSRARITPKRGRISSEFRLDLVEVHRQLAVAADLAAHRLAEDLFRSGCVAELALGAVLHAQHQRAVEVPAPRLLPELAWLHGRSEDLERAGAIHLLAHDRLDAAHDAKAEREPRVEAAAQFPDQSGAQHELVAGDFGVGGYFLDGGEVETGQAHAGVLFFGRKGRQL